MCSSKRSAHAFCLCVTKGVRVSVWVWADVREYSWILACGQETSSFSVYREGMSQSVGCLLKSCCPLVCEGFIIELAQALWPNVGGTLSSNATLLAHYLWNEVRKNCIWKCVYLLKMGETWADVCIFVGRKCGFCAFEIKIHPLSHSLSPGYLALPQCHMWRVCVYMCDGSGWLLDLRQCLGCGDDCFIIRPCVNLWMFNGCRTRPSIRALGALREPENWRVFFFSSRE